MLPVGVDNPYITMASNDLVNFGQKFLNSAKQHQINEIQKDIASSRYASSVANRIKNGPSVSEVKSSVSSASPQVSLLDLFSDSDTVQKPTYKAANSSHGVASTSVSPNIVDYLNADLAKHYGLGASTAYQEALSNTAYQRAVKDMKAAGLNPSAIFGAGKGYTAGGVSYVEPGNTGSNSLTFGSSYKRNDEQLFSEGAYHAISTAVGLAGMVLLNQGPIGYYISETAAKAVMGAMNEISR